MSQLVRREYQCDPGLVARWLESQPGTWWFVDGDPYLTGKMDVPCPAEELADALADEEKTLVVISEQSLGDSDSLTKVDQFVGLVDHVKPQDPSSNRVWLCRWQDSDDEWLLVEDQEAAKLFGEGDDEEA